MGTFGRSFAIVHLNLVDLVNGPPDLIHLDLGAGGFDTGVVSRVIVT